MKATIRDNSKRARHAKTAAYVYLNFMILSLIASVYLRIFMIDINHLSYEEINSKTLIHNFIELINIFLFIINGLFFSFWFQRSYYNAHTMTDKAEYSIELAGYCWIIPILNLFAPFYVAKDILKITNKNLRSIGTLENVLEKSTPIDIWWLMVILNSIGFIFIKFVIGMNFESREDVTYFFNLMVIFYVLSILSTLSYIFYINAASEAEIKLKELKINEPINHSGLTDNEV